MFHDGSAALEAPKCSYFQSVLLSVSFEFLLQSVVIIVLLIIHFLFGPELANKEGKDEVLLDNDGEEEDDPDHHPDGQVGGGGGWVDVELRELAADSSRYQSQHKVVVRYEAFQGSAWAARKGLPNHTNAQENSHLKNCNWKKDTFIRHH